MLAGPSQAGGLGLLSGPEVIRRDAREAEGAPLLREYRVKSSIEGSNPSLSARYDKAAERRLCRIWLRSRDFLPAPAARALIGTTSLRFVSGAVSPLSLREMQQGRRRAALSYLDRSPASDLVQERAALSEFVGVRSRATAATRWPSTG